MPNPYRHNIYRVYDLVPDMPREVYESGLSEEEAQAAVDELNGDPAIAGWWHYMVGEEDGGDAFSRLSEMRKR